MQSCLEMNTPAVSDHQVLTRLDTAASDWSSQTALPHAFSDSDAKWPMWKTAWFVLGVCGSFWTAVIIGATKLF